MMVTGQNPYLLRVIFVLQRILSDQQKQDESAYPNPRRGAKLLFDWDGLPRRNNPGIGGLMDASQRAFQH